MGKDVCDLIANALSNAATEPIQGVQSKGTSKKWNVPSRQVLMGLAQLARKGLSKLSSADPNMSLDISRRPAWAR